MTRKTDILLQLKILSTPTIWPDEGKNSWLIAFVGGQEGQNGEKITEVDAYLPNGRRALGFPILRHSPYVIAPGNQLTDAIIDGDNSAKLLALDIQGRPLAFRAGGTRTNISPAGNPVRALLAWQPTYIRLGTPSKSAMVLVTRHFSPEVGSRNALDVMDTSGMSLPGFPMDLESYPELHRPLMWQGSERVFVLLESGAVDGVDLARAARLHGFPTVPVTASPAKSVRKMALYVPWNALVVSGGTGGLTRIDAATGQASYVAVAPSGRLTGIDSAGDRLYVVDDAASRLLRIDSQGRIAADLPLNIRPPSHNWQLQSLPVPNSQLCYVVMLSEPDSDPDAKVALLFEQHATPEIRRKIAELADAEAVNRFHSNSLNQEQQKEIDHSVTMMKLSYLQNTLGADKTAQILGGQTQSRVQVALDGDGPMRLVLDDTVEGYTPETGFGPSPVIYPVVHGGNGVLHLIVPLNAERVGDDPRTEYRSLIRVYDLPY